VDVDVDVDMDVGKDRTGEDSSCVEPQHAQSNLKRCPCLDCHWGSEGTNAPLLVFGISIVRACGRFEYWNLIGSILRHD